MAALENGLAAVATASGQAAQFMAIATIVCSLFRDEITPIDRGFH